MTKDFDDFIQTVVPDKEGFFFAPMTKFGQRYQWVKNLGRVISQIGEKAGIIS